MGGLNSCGAESFIGIIRHTIRMPLAEGARFGSFELLGRLGAGGMGEVYRARDTQLGRDVALKVLPALFADDPERRARFAREARTLAALITRTSRRSTVWSCRTASPRS